MKIKFVFLLSLVLLGSIACEKTPPSSTRPKLALTITPLAFFAESIGGPQIEYSIMLPAGSDPHHYEPSPAELGRFTASDAIVKSGGPGLDFETNLLPKIGKLAGQINVFDVSRGIVPLPEDPHIWLSYSNGITIANNLTVDLCNLDSANCKLYRSRNIALAGKIRDAEKAAARAFQHRKTNYFLVFHPAWTYLARDFGLHQIAVEAGGKEPGPAMLAQVIDRAKSNGVRAIFVSPQFSQKSARTIAAEIDIELISINPLERDWLNNMQNAVGKLAEALNK